MTVDLTVRVAVVGDSPTWTRWLAGRNDHHPGALVIDVPPLSTVRAGDVAEAILDGLGKDRRLRVAKRPVEHLCAAWLGVTDRTDALVADVTVLPLPVLDDLINMLVGFGIRPWLIVPWGDFHDPETRANLADDLVERYDGDIVGPDELIAAWPDQPDPDVDAPEPAGDDVWPIVPRVDGLFFRSAVRDLLEPDDAAHVDAYFRSTVAAIRDELDSVADANRTREFERRLRNRMHDAGCDDELITVVRAAQVAGAIRGFHVQANPVRLYGAAAVFPRRGAAAHDDWWGRLDRYPDPDIPAVAALHLAGMALADIRTLTTEHVTTTAGPVVVTGDSGATVTVVGPPARFVRAAVTWRYLGAGPGPLFSTHRADSISDRRIGYLARASTDVGVRHTGPKASRQEPTAKLWLDNFGVVIGRCSKQANR